MSEEMTELAREIADLKRDVRPLVDEADRLIRTRIIDDADVRKLLEKLAGVVL